MLSKCGLGVKLRYSLSICPVFFVCSQIVNVYIYKHVPLAGHRIDSGSAMVAECNAEVKKSQ